MLAYIDAGTATAIAAMATGGLAGAKVAAQTFMTKMKKSKSAERQDTVTHDGTLGAEPAKA